MQTANIAYILTPIEFGGAERVSLTFLANVDRRRFRISLAALVRPWEQDSLLLQRLARAGYPITRVPVARQPRTVGPDRLRLVRCFRRIHAFLKQGAFDVVHSHGYFADIMAVPAARMLGIPHMATCHGFIGNDRSLRCYNRMDRLVLRFSSRIIAVSDDIRNELVSCGIRANRLRVIRNAVASRNGTGPDSQVRSAVRYELGIPAHDFVIGYLGRLSPEKGLVHLIDACGLLKRAGVHLKLLLAGEGPQREELLIRAASEGLEDRIVFSGFRSDTERLLQAMDVFVLPSLTEGTPMALLEAMAAGLPAVASAVGGVPDVLEQDTNGLLVRPSSAEDIARAVERLCRDGLLRRRLSREARATIRRHYDVRAWTASIESEYDALIDQGRSRRQAARWAS